MFNWIDKSVNKYIEKKKKELTEYMDKKMSIASSELDSNFLIHTEALKGKFHKRCDELDEFMICQSEKIKKDFSEQDVHLMLKKHIEEYIKEIYVEPMLIENEECLSNYDVELIKTASFSDTNEEKIVGSPRSQVTEFTREGAYQKSVAEGLKAGQKIGADIMFAKIQRENIISYNWGNEKMLCKMEVIVNCLFYKVKNIKKTIESNQLDESVYGKNPENLILGVR